MGIGNGDTGFHHRDEIPEKVIAVMWTRGSLGMILNAEERKPSMPESLVGSIVQVHVRHLDEIGAECRRIHGKPVVLCGDFNSICQQIFHRMVAPPMAEFQLERLPSQRKPAEWKP